MTDEVRPCSCGIACDPRIRQANCGRSTCSHLPRDYLPILRPRWICCLFYQPAAECQGLLHTFQHLLFAGLAATYKSAAVRKL